MAAQDRKRPARQMMLSFFLGLMVVGLVGAGVHTFYPSPGQSESELQQLNDQQKALDKARLAAGSISPSREALYKKVSDKIATEKKALQAGRDSWVRITSIILIAFGTLFVGASFAVASQMLAVSNGLLLGGSSRCGTALPGRSPEATRTLASWSLGSSRS